MESENHKHSYMIPAEILYEVTEDGGIIHKTASAPILNYDAIQCLGARDWCGEPAPKEFRELVKHRELVANTPY